MDHAGRVASMVGRTSVNLASVNLASVNLGGLHSIQPIIALFGYTPERCRYFALYGMDVG